MTLLGKTFLAFEVLTLEWGLIKIGGFQTSLRVGRFGIQSGKREEFSYKVKELRLKGTLLGV